MIFNFNSQANDSTDCKLDHTYRVAIIEFGPTHNTQLLIKELLKRLMDHQYMPNYQFENQFHFDDPTTYKLRMSQDLSQKCLKFPEQELYNANWNYETLKDMVTQLKNKIKNKEIDMVWALGNHAIDLMCNEDSDIPILGMMCTDPNKLSAPQFSQYNNVHTLVEMRLFADFLEGYQSTYLHENIGILKDKNPLFDSYADVQRVKEYSQNHKINLQVCEGNFFTADENLAHQEFARCMQELSDKNVEAIYLSELAAGPDLKHFYTQIKPLLLHKTFVYSYESYDQIKAGSLMGFFDGNMDCRATVEFRTLDNFFKGEKLHRINQHITIPYFFGINLKTASLMQWRPTFSMLVAADEIFQNINSD